MRKIMMLLAGVLVAGVVQAADEISVAGNIAIKKGYLSMNVSESVAATMTGDSTDHRTTSTTTNAALLEVSTDIGIPGIALFKNSSTNHVILIGPSASLPFAKLKAGEIWLGRLATNVVYVSTDPVYYAAYTNIVSGVTNAYPASTNVLADLESVIIEE